MRRFCSFSCQLRGLAGVAPPRRLDTPLFPALHQHLPVIVHTLFTSFWIVWMVSAVWTEPGLLALVHLPQTKGLAVLSA